ncbi:MAG: hypothetical protein IIZ39_12210 [Blautia sp.]|nr:hypothetical protein [Blautia sp.]
MEDRKEESKEEKIPYTCTPAYDRSRCGSCSCASCYLQEFCDRCKDCQDLSRFKERCNAYEGALTY